MNPGATSGRRRLCRILRSRWWGMAAVALLLQPLGANAASSVSAGTPAAPASTAVGLVADAIGPPPTFFGDPRAIAIVPSDLGHVWSFTGENTSEVTAGAYSQDFVYHGPIGADPQMHVLIDVYDSVPSATLVWSVEGNEVDLGTINVGAPQIGDDSFVEVTQASVPTEGQSIPTPQPNQTYVYALRVREGNVIFFITERSAQSTGVSPGLVAWAGRTIIGRIRQEPPY